LIWDCCRMTRRRRATGYSPTVWNRTNRWREIKIFTTGGTEEHRGNFRPYARAIHRDELRGPGPYLGPRIERLAQERAKWKTIGELATDQTEHRSALAPAIFHLLQSRHASIYENTRGDHELRHARVFPRIFPRSPRGPRTESVSSQRPGRNSGAPR
jgi:hypothetical protein